MAKRLPTGIFKPKSKKKGWESKVYHFRLVVDGKRLSFEGYTDLELTIRLRADLLRAIERHQAGEAVKPSSNKLLQRHMERLKLVNPLLTKSLDEWIDDYEQALKVKGDSADHLSRTKMRLQKLVRGCGWLKLADFDPDEAANWLHQQMAEGKLGKTTRNHYAKILQAFGRFVSRRDGEVPNLTALELLATEDDVRVLRRPLTAEELPILLAATAKNENKRQLPPASRVMLYRLAITSGLRACELASLTPNSFRLDATPPTVSVQATISKRRKLDTLPLQADVAEALQQFLKRKPAAEKLWPGRWFRRAAEMLRSDLTAAGIPPVDQQGRKLDFHAVRHGFVTRLALAGVAPKIAQTLARHSTIDLTMNVYSHVEQATLAGALDQAFVRPFVRNGGPKGRGKARRGARGLKPK